MNERDIRINKYQEAALDLACSYGLTKPEMVEAFVRLGAISGAVICGKRPTPEDSAKGVTLLVELFTLELIATAQKVRAEHEAEQAKNAAKAADEVIAKAAQS